MIHSLLSATAALVLLPAGTAFIATLIRPQLAPVVQPRDESENSVWWRSIARADLGVVPRDAHLTLTAGAPGAVLSVAGQSAERTVPLHCQADGACALRFSYHAATALECTLPPEYAGVTCPTGALAISHAPDHTRILLPAGEQECCLVWRAAPASAAERIQCTPAVPLATR